MKRFIIVLVIITALILPQMAAAQDANPQTVPADIPAEHRLTGLDMLWQQYNRCSATALYMQMSYFDYTGSATDIVRWLNPYAEDMSVRLEELIGFAGTQGLLGLERTGGTRELMQRVVAAGFPLLVENAYWHRNDDGDWMSHNRILMGYDGGSFYFYDPLLGPGEDHTGYGIRYEEFDERWHDFNRNYMILYRPDQTEQLKAVLGIHWEPDLNAEFTLQQAEADYAAMQDGFSAYNAASALHRLGRYEEAAQWMDTARAIGLPWRMHWYRFEAMDVYLSVGRWDDVLNVVYEVLETSQQIAEVYYYAAQAYEGMGNLERARLNYLAALDRNANYPAAQEALDALDGA